MIVDKQCWLLQADHLLHHIISYFMFSYLQKMRHRGRELNKGFIAVNIER